MQSYYLVYLILKYIQVVGSYDCDQKIYKFKVYSKPTRINRNCVVILEPYTIPNFPADETFFGTQCLTLWIFDQPITYQIRHLSYIQKIGYMNPNSTLDLLNRRLCYVPT